MPALVEEWLPQLWQRLGQAAADDAGVAALTMVTLSLLFALLGRHRRTAVETVVLAAVALLLVRFWELPAAIVAAGAVANALQGASRRRGDMQLQALARQIAGISADLQDFLGALDRRSHEIDLRARDLEDTTVTRTLETVSEVTATFANGKPDASVS